MGCGEGVKIAPLVDRRGVTAISAFWVYMLASDESREINVQVNAT